jgi:hypothetical protein
MPGRGRLETHDYPGHTRGGSMVGIVLTLAAVVAVICLAFCHSGRNTLMQEHVNTIRPGKRQKP